MKRDGQVLREVVMTVILSAALCRVLHYVFGVKPLHLLNFHTKLQEGGGD